MAADKDKKKALAVEAPAKTGTKGKGKGKDISGQVCLYHDLKANVSCPGLGTTCKRRHLDTNVPAEKQEFDDAKKSVQAFRDRKAKRSFGQVAVKKEE